MPPINPARTIITALLIFTTCAIADNGEALNMDMPHFYGQVPWASVHRDSRNSDFIPLVTLPNLRTSWSVLDGAALINPGVIDANGHHFMTTGRGHGFSHLHAFDQDGKLLWETAPQQDLNDFDALAGFNAPVLDAEGDLYVGDGNQFWAFHPDGRLKWVTDLPEPGEPFVYQIISRQGYVGGITVGGGVLFYERDDGRLAVPAFKLPTGVAPERGPNLPGLWGGGLFDASAAELFKQIAFGYNVQVANAPAVHPDTGRIFITAAGPKNGDAHSGVLYGLDLTDDGIEIAFATKMGGGSGTSPALSTDSKHVYSADGEGRMLAVDTSDGRIVWAASGEGLLSPAIGADGTIYTGDIFGAPTVVALNPEDGSRRWARSYDDYATTHLPALAPERPHLPTGKPVARLVSVISTSANAVWVGMILGYQYRPPNSPLTLTIPHKTVVCALDPLDGKLLDCVHVRDTVEGMIKIGTGGRLFVSHTSIFGSTAYYGFNDDLPPAYRAPTKPVGGVTAMIPESFCRQLQLELAETKNLYVLALETRNDNEADTASVARLARMQLAAMDDTLKLALANDELSATDAERLQRARRSSPATLTNMPADFAQAQHSYRKLTDNHPTLTCAAD
jgi:outer membrane protein assembly factor BamB